MDAPPRILDDSRPAKKVVDLGQMSIRNVLNEADAGDNLRYTEQGRREFTHQAGQESPSPMNVQQIESPHQSSHYISNPNYNSFSPINRPPNSTTTEIRSLDFGPITIQYRLYTRIDDIPESSFTLARKGRDSGLEIRCIHQRNGTETELRKALDSLAEMPLTLEEVSQVSHTSADLRGGASSTQDSTPQAFAGMSLHNDHDSGTSLNMLNSPVSPSNSTHQDETFRRRHQTRLSEQERRKLDYADRQNRRKDQVVAALSGELSSGLSGTSSKSPSQDVSDDDPPPYVSDHESSNGSDSPRTPASDSSSAEQGDADYRCSFIGACQLNSPDRKVVSHFFGRNKKCTLAIPEELCVGYCRKHYQRTRYRNAASFAVLQLDLIKAQIDNIEEWGGADSFNFVLRKRVMTRLNEENAYTIACQNARSKGLPQPPSISGAPLPCRWILPHLGNDKTFGEIRRIVDLIEQKIKATKGDLPEFEILPNIKPEFQRQPRPRRPAAARAHAAVHAKRRAKSSKATTTRQRLAATASTSPQGGSSS